MSAPKPLAEGCTAGINCPVTGHVQSVRRPSGRWKIHHIYLTPGQYRTLDERWRAERQAKAEKDIQGTQGLG